MQTTRTQADKLATAVYHEAIKLGFNDEQAQMILNQTWDILVHGELQSNE